jgi:hypothetical protein
MLVLRVLLQEVVLQIMVFEHMGKNENCLHMNKRKKTRGLRLNSNYPRLSFNKDCKPALA